eukprot:TRINITY_DN15554_c0_g1_i1.p1 TRINITY_DN15554_c0_g1~~TRINITY_DN15554_c0_g1_i1.p1  ORF type:complete len:342 (-),score=36.47 TRINITY_DN15554_c0_g1_i1:22-1047(-)
MDPQFFEELLSHVEPLSSQHFELPPLSSDWLFEDVSLLPEVPAEAPMFYKPSEIFGRDLVADSASLGSPPQQLSPSHSTAPESEALVIGRVSSSNSLATMALERSTSVPFPRIQPRALHRQSPKTEPTMSPPASTSAGMPRNVSSGSLGGLSRNTSSGNLAGMSRNSSSGNLAGMSRNTSSGNLAGMTRNTSSGNLGGMPRNTSSGSLAGMSRNSSSGNLSALDDLDLEDVDEDPTPDGGSGEQAVVPRKRRYGEPSGEHVRPCPICLTPKRRIYRYLGAQEPMCNACNQHWRRHNHDCPLCKRLEVACAQPEMRGVDIQNGKPPRERKWTHLPGEVSEPY